jgi:hypothetical protein
MKNAELNTTLINSYFELFRRLSSRGKKELISKLNRSMQMEKPDQSEAFFSTFGAFQDKKSAKEIIQEINNNRTFNRNTAEL